MGENPTLETVQKVIDSFLGSEGIISFELYLDGLEITEREFEDLIGNYDSSNGAINNNEAIDEYVYDIDIYEESPGNCVKFMKKLIFKYRIIDEESDHNLILYYVQGFDDKIEVDCEP
jgi:hypothetical protein